MPNYAIYQTYLKPFWAPPAWLFGPVWTVLYILIAISFGYVFYQSFNKKWKLYVYLPFILNLFFNLIFTPIQFGLKNNLLAMVDIFLVLVTLLWGMIEIYPKKKWITFMNLPYLLWVIFASILQVSITVLNHAP